MGLGVEVVQPAGGDEREEVRCGLSVIVGAEERACATRGAASMKATEGSRERTARPRDEMGLIRSSV
ncbi:MAG: hypothetical protein BGO98_40230 [Myxococcales bacterium 68-20]|nr:MAG: hypothetical protein BGO98_40230 [Myxococcales bacterium 68-20]